MINFEDYAKQNKKKQSRLAICSRSSIQNNNNRRDWIWKKESFIKFNKQALEALEIKQAKIKAVKMYCIIEIVLVYCDIFNNDYQQNPRVLNTFVPNKPFGSL